VIVNDIFVIKLPTSRLYEIGRPPANVANLHAIVTPPPFYSMSEYFARFLFKGGFYEQGPLFEVDRRTIGFIRRLYLTF